MDRIRETIERRSSLSEPIQVGPDRWKSYLQFEHTVPYNEEIVTGGVNSERYQAYRRKMLDEIERGDYELPLEEDDQECTYMIENENGIVGAADACLEDDDAEWLHLMSVKVNPTVRGRGVAQKLVRCIEQWGRKRGCEYIYTDINQKNPLSLCSFFQQGYLTGAFLGGIFKMYKNLERGDGEVELKTGETVEIPLSDTEALTSLLDSGYVGVDIKNIYQEGEMISLSDRQDLNPKHWTLILTKKS